MKEVKITPISEQGTVIEQRLIELAEATTSGIGIWRAIYLESDRVGKDMVRRWMEEAGLDTYEDGLGNLFGRVEGVVEDTVLVGSHIDTVKDGGKYDGAAGVVTAISAVGELIKQGWKPYYSLEVVALEEEEGSRYPLAYIGSRSILGVMEADELEYTDENGIPLSRAMREAEYDPIEVIGVKHPYLKEYVELHVEQGPYLDQMGIPIGIVENIVGLSVFEITVTGHQNHAGTTPMSMRKDPVAAAAGVIASMTEEIRRISETAVLTVGEFSVKPGVSNVIADQARFTVDMRDGSPETLKRGTEMLERHLNGLREQGFGIQTLYPCAEPPARLDSAMIEDLEQAAKELEIPCVRMNSGAGHDAQVFAQVLPACMIFVPSVDGISHSPKEYTRPEDLSQGCRVLAQLLRRRTAPPQVSEGKN